LVKIIFQI
jgi:hypothetical protein